MNSTFVYEKHSITHYSLHALQQSCTKAANPVGSWIKMSTKATSPRTNKNWCFYRSTSIASQKERYHMLNVHCDTMRQYQVLNIIDCICITTLTQPLSLLYSCIPIATRLHCQPMRSSSNLKSTTCREDEFVLNACTVANR